MSQTEQQICELLDKTNNNVPEVARQLNLSVSYVTRIKNKRTELVPASPTALEQSSNQLMQSPIEPNVEGVVELRDTLIESLQLKADALSAGEQRRLLEVLLGYETALRQAYQPQALAFFQQNDNRQVNVFEGMVKKMADNLDPTLLAKIAGADYLIEEGEIVDG